MRWRMHARTLLRLCAHAHTHTHTHIRAHTHTRTHTYVHTHTRTHAHTHTRAHERKHTGPCVSKNMRCVEEDFPKTRRPLQLWLRGSQPSAWNHTTHKQPRCKHPGATAKQTEQWNTTGSCSPSQCRHTQQQHRKRVKVKWKKCFRLFGRTDIETRSKRLMLLSSG